MDKEVVEHIYNRILAIRRNKFESVVVRWMNLEPIIQNEVSQKETNILIHIYMESRKIVLINSSAGKEWRQRHREQSCGLSWGRREWDKLRKQH